MNSADSVKQPCRGFRSLVGSVMRHLHLQDEDVKAGLLADKNTFFAWQRNHMANERTFLSWCRTGISLIVFGFVIERFDLLIRELRVYSPDPGKFAHADKTHYMALVIFILGACIILLAGWRFFHTRHHINQAQTQFTPLPEIILLISVLGTVAVVTLFFVFLL